MGFESRGPSVSDTLKCTNRNALTDKAWEEAVQGTGQWFIVIDDSHTIRLL